MADYERTKRDYYQRKQKKLRKYTTKQTTETQKAESYYYKTLAEHHDLLREAESISEHYKRKAEEENDHDQEVPFLKKPQRTKNKSPGSRQNPRGKTMPKQDPPPSNTKNTEHHKKSSRPKTPKTPKSTRSEGDGATTTKPRPQSNDPSQAENPKKKERKREKTRKTGKKEKRKKEKHLQHSHFKKKYTWFLCIFSFLKWENYQVFFCFLRL